MQVSSVHISSTSDKYRKENKGVGEREGGEW